MKKPFIPQYALASKEQVKSARDAANNFIANTNGSFNDYRSVACAAVLEYILNQDGFTAFEHLAKKD